MMAMLSMIRTVDIDSMWQRHIPRYEKLLRQLRDLAKHGTLVGEPCELRQRHPFG